MSQTQTTPVGSKRKAVLMGAAVVAVIAGAYFIYETLNYVNTDNAQIQAPTVMLAAKVPGYVTKVNITDNQKVKSGDVLVEIDDRDYENTLTQIQNEMGSVAARANDAATNYHRIADLYKKGVVSQQQYDTATATNNEMKRKLEAVQAQVAQAKLNLEHTKIIAPADGIIAKKSVEPGMLAAIGVPMIGFVSNEERWVVANFKETEIADIHVGKDVEVKVDAIPGQKYHGKVESMSGATGATFTLLPPDNATGNFTKVVQRVPVRIKLDQLKEADIDDLKAGLSALVSVHIH